MKGLLIIAHGSRLNSSNNEVAQLASKLREANLGRFDEISHSFLELTKPKVESSIEDLVSKGCSDITLFPYFLAAGYHVTSDLPALVKAARQNYPQVNFNLLPHLGASSSMPELILGAVS